MGSTASKRSRHQRAIAILACIPAALLLGASALAQPYTLEWSNTDGSTGTSSGGDFAINATMGQPDAGSLAGGDYVLEGGFWPGLIVPSENTPTLLIQFREESLTISWSPPRPGFTLEMTDNLRDGPWVPASDPEANPSVIVPTGSAQFFRLVRRP